VLELNGPKRLIDTIERSLFTIGAVTARVNPESDEFLVHPQLLEILTGAQTRAGILTLLVRESDLDELTVRVEDDSIKVDTREPMAALSAVHQLLRRAGIFIAVEGANL
jgi:hypothetical protein